MRQNRATKLSPETVTQSKKSHPRQKQGVAKKTNWIRIDQRAYLRSQRKKISPRTCLQAAETRPLTRKATPSTSKRCTKTRIAMRRCPKPKFWGSIVTLKISRSFRVSVDRRNFSNRSRSSKIGSTWRRASNRLAW